MSNKVSDSAKAAKKDADAIQSETTNIIKEVSSLVTAPVAGPFLVTLLWLLSVLAVSGYFLYLVSFSARTWNEPVTKIQDKHVTEHLYPDIYLCLPGVYADTYKDQRKTDMYYITGGLNDSHYKVLKDKCGDDAKSATARFLKVNPISMLAIDDATACPVKAVYGTAHSEEDRYGFLTGCDMARARTAAKEKKRDTCVNLDEAPTLESAVDILANLLPTSENKVKPSCLKFEMKPGASQKYDEHQKYMLFQKHYLESTSLSNSPFMVAYLTPQGTTPYYTNESGKKVLNSTQIFFPGPPKIAVAFLHVETVTDSTGQSMMSALVTSRLTKTTAQTRTNYGFHMWQKDESHFQRVEAEFVSSTVTTNIEVSDYGQTGIGFAFDDFIVRNIVIRYKTATEIFAEIGGLWAGCGALLWIFWAKSGRLRKNADGSVGGEMMILKYLCLCKSTKKQWLEDSVEMDAKV